MASIDLAGSGMARQLVDDLKQALDRNADLIWRQLGHGSGRVELHCNTATRRVEVRVVSSERGTPTPLGA